MNKNTSIINHHIPRCIFGVKYNIEYGNTMEFNVQMQFENKKEQSEYIASLKKIKGVSDVKPLKWLIKY